MLRSDQDQNLIVVSGAVVTAGQGSPAVLVAWHGTTTLSFFTRQCLAVLLVLVLGGRPGRVLYLMPAERGIQLHDHGHNVMTLPR